MDDIDLIRCIHEHHNTIINNNAEDLSGDPNKARDKIWMLSKKQKRDLLNGYLKAIESEKEISIIFLICAILKLLGETKCYKISKYNYIAKHLH